MASQAPVLATNSFIVSNVSTQMTSEGIVAVINGTFEPSNDIVGGATSYRHKKVSDIWISYNCSVEPYGWVVTDTDNRGTDNGYAFLETPFLLLPDQIPLAERVWKIYDGRLDQPTMAQRVSQKAVTTVSVYSAASSTGPPNSASERARTEAALRRVAALEAELRAREEADVQRAIEESRGGAGAPQPPPKLEDDKLCIVCMEGEKNIANLPCGHVCLCALCSESASVANCPVCRAPITGKLRLFGI